jgi:hypothetical protein
MEHEPTGVSDNRSPLWDPHFPDRDQAPGSLGYYQGQKERLGLTEQKYPEHQKLQAVKDKSQAIGEFIEWLMCTKKLTIARWMKVPAIERDPFAEKGEEIDELMPEHIDIEALLAEYYSIDRKTLEEEKQAMLEDMRQMNQREKQ